MLLSLVERGFGISVMPLSYSLARHPGVRFIPLPFEVPLYLHWREKEDNAIIRNILTLIAP
jgi:DNA-binding transcriptional LysR family regulator